MQETITPATPRRTVAPHGAAARVFLSFLATAGLFYVNIMPAIVDGLIEGLGFTAAQAGMVGSANVYGAAVGALIIVFAVGRLPWRRTAYALLGTLILMDLLSMLILLPLPLTTFRFVHGVVGGALVGVAFAVIARMLNPDRTFGVLLVVQFGLGGLGNLFLPRLVPVFGPNVLFLSLIAFSLAALAMLPFLPAYRPSADRVGLVTAARGRSLRLPVLMVMASVFLFQAANMGLFAFIIGLGRHYGLELPFITTTLALAGWIGIVGPVIVIAIHTRYGRALPLVIAMLLTIVGTWALHYSGVPWLFFAANCLVGITWAFVMPYLLGLCSEFDVTGRMAALGGFASKMGLASGPLVAGFLLGEDNYGLLINLAVIALLASALASVIPARLKDRKHDPAGAGRETTS